MVYDGFDSLKLEDEGNQNKIKKVALDKKPGSKRFSTASSNLIYFWIADVAGGEKTRGLFRSAKKSSIAYDTSDAHSVY